MWNGWKPQKFLIPTIKMKKNLLEIELAIKKDGGEEKEYFAFFDI